MTKQEYLLPSQQAEAPVWARLWLGALLAGAGIGCAGMVARVACGAL